jgi:hypothetical protein
MRDEDMPKRLTVTEVDALAEVVRATLARADSGELAATAPTTYRLQGALVALDAVRGVGTAEILQDLLGGA